MGKSKLDSRLSEELERQKSSGSAESFHVVITCSAEIYIPQGLTGSGLGAHVDQEVKTIQGPVMKDLRALGVRQIKSLPMSNRIEAHVTAEQLTDIEKLESVASIRLSSLDHVAL